MKTICKQLKTALQADSSLSNIKRFEIVAPKLLPEIASSQVPFLGIAPVSTSETWVAQRKQAVHTVDLYIVDFLQIQENAIIGDTVKPGLLELVSSISDVVRGQRLTVDGNFYLAKPIEITGIDYMVTGYGDATYLFVASMSLQCVRVFNITLPV